MLSSIESKQAMRVSLSIWNKIPEYFETVPPNTNFHRCAQRLYDDPRGHAYPVRKCEPGQPLFDPHYNYLRF